MFIDKNGRRWSVELVSISLLKQGDVVVHCGEAVTVSDCDVKRCDFMGVTFRGDSYILGSKKIQRLTPAH